MKPLNDSSKTSFWFYESKHKMRDILLYCYPTLLGKLYAHTKKCNSCHSQKDKYCLMTPLYEVPRAAQFTDRRLGEGKHEGLVFNGDRAAVWEDEKISGDRWW